MPAERSGSIQGRLPGDEDFTAFLLEAIFFGVVMFGRAHWFLWAAVLSFPAGANTVIAGWKHIMHH